MLYNKINKLKLKNWYFPLFTGGIFIAIGIFVFIIPADFCSQLLPFFGIGFIFSGVAIFILSLLNRNIINDWVWYLIFGIIISSMGSYFVICVNNLFSFVLDLMLLFHSCILLGTYLDQREILDFKQYNFYFTSILGIVFSTGLILSHLNDGSFRVYLIAIAFIINGISNIFLSLGFKKYGRSRKSLKILLFKSNTDYNKD
ncbi:hypothetical protein BAY05_12440 [Elizabethkingia anophelis]|nr:hypothetical protein BAY05_12440 [Elizabethkingia anophelis]